jgi:hypothetical protein
MRLTHRALLQSSIACAMTSKAYTPRHRSWPYSPNDFGRYDSSPDASFYHIPRFVTHIDDHAISKLEAYYSSTLPHQGVILDLCSSWISHLPPDLENLAKDRSSGFKVIGMGMNKRELDGNPVLSETIVQDLNDNPTIPPIGPLDTATCVVSIDYLTRPLEVLSSLRRHLKGGSTVHLVVSNRCFPTKVIRRWLETSEPERLEMVADYLHFAGFVDIQIVELSDGWAILPPPDSDSVPGNKVRVDPLWVVRGTAPSL